MVTVNRDNVSAPASLSASTDSQQYCYAHPTTETGLACIQCERPICVRCMIPSSVGQLCKACARERQPVQYRVTRAHLIIGAVFATVCGFLLAIPALFLIGLLPLYSVWLTLLLAGPAAGLVVRILDKASRGRRGKRFQITVGIGITLGALPMLASALFFFWVTDALMLGIFVGMLVYRTMVSLR